MLIISRGTSYSVHCFEDVLALDADGETLGRAALLERTVRWLEQAGVTVPRKADGTPDATIEISLRRAVCAEDVAELVQAGQIPRSFAPGAQFALD